ncbi:MAG: Hpt domain-containing protein [Spirochaetales bacterium]|nr:Hpt domain-containing protein [Spirochaetales bacterium]
MIAIDFDEAIDRFDGDADIYHELLAAFLESGDTDVLAFEEAAITQEREKALYHIHKLKGAALTLGANALAAQAETGERILRSGTMDGLDVLTPLIRELYNQTLAEVPAIMAFLEKQIES